MSSYGSGALPKISANGKSEDALLLLNQEYWDISNLDISNTSEGLENIAYIEQKDDNGSKLKDLRGICVAGDDAGQLNHFRLHNLYIHDVTGELGRRKWSGCTRNYKRKWLG